MASKGKLQHWHRGSIFTFLAVVSIYGCKQNQTNRTNAPTQPAKSDSAEQLPEVGPFANDANDEELRKQFLALVEQYKSANIKELSLSKKIDPLSRPRRAQTLNLKMRQPVAMIAKTAGRQGATDTGAPIRAAGGKIRKELREANIVNVVFSEAKDDRHMAAVLEFLSRDSRIEMVEPDYTIKLKVTPNDPRFSELWGLRNTNANGADINVLQAWDRTTGHRDIVVGVIDTGIDCTHPDLAPNCWVNPGEDGQDSAGKDKRTNGIDDDGNGYIDDWQGWNFVDKTNNAADDHYHGTHVAGTIGAVGNNGLGVVGVNWRVSLVPLKFLSFDGSGSISDAIEAIDYATKMKFFATNNSWGGGPFSELLRAAIARADAAGIHFLAAAGNDGTNNDRFPQYPASYEEPNIIAVAAIDPNGQFASFSCYGATSVDVAAPGTKILSTTPNNAYDSLNGTSMATPHVAGALALLKSAFPDESPAALRTRLTKGVSPLPTQTKTQASIRTNGMINVSRSMTWVPDVVPPSVPLNLAVIDRDIDKVVPSSVTATIMFKQSGEDGDVGQAARYVLRFSESESLDNLAWGSARNLTIFSIEKDRPDGMVKVSVKGLPFNTKGWIFARAYDDDDNESPISLPVRFRGVNATALKTYDGLTAVGSPSSWTTEIDPNRGQVYSDGVGSYEGNAKKRMTLHPFTIPDGMQRIVLRYWTKYSLERNWDYVRLKIQGDAGYDTEIEKITGHADWSERVIDLTTIAHNQMAKGKTSLTLYFELEADGYWNYDGMLLDDIEFLVNDTFVKSANIPDISSTESNLAITLSGAAGSLYTAKFLAEKYADCANLIYDSTEPNIPITTPISLNQSTGGFGQRSLCIKAKVTGITNIVYANYQWFYENVLAMVQASGMPTGRSGQKSFTLQVSRASGSQATSFSYAVATVPEYLSAEQVCRGEGSALSWSAYLPIANAPTITVNGDGSVFTKTIALCVRGEVNGTYQAIPASYSWIADFEGPTIELENKPVSPNNLSTIKLSIKSVEELSACKVKLISGWTPNCPAVTDGYMNCSEPPKSHVINLTTDGDYTVCMYGVDTLGNLSPAPIAHSWTRDATPPQAVFSGTPPITADKPQSLMYVTGAGVHRFRYATAKTPEECRSWSAFLPAGTPIMLSIVPNGDGPRAICAYAQDELGNEQATPTVRTWIQDTIALPAEFSQLPEKSSKVTSVYIGVSSPEPAKYRYSLYPGATCDLARLNSSSLRALPSKIAESLPSTDGPITVCAVTVDDVGNRQQNPTSYTWIKDTRPPTVTLAGLPAAQSAEPNLNVTVSGEDATHYAWALQSGSGSCTSATYSEFVPVTTKITAAAGAAGLKRLCVKGRDAAGNVQTSPTSYDWTQLASLVVASGGVPFSPSSATSYKINLTGINAPQYQYALIRSRGSNCVTNVKYSGWLPLASELNLPVAANVNGFMTLCLRGKNSANQIQPTPSIYRWLQIPKTTPPASSEVIMTISQASRARNSQTLNFTRLGSVLPTETFASRLCLYRVSDGALVRCVDGPVSFAQGALTTAVTYTGISSGTWVAFIVPSSANRGRVEPLVFGY